jgi:hypothetical protein
VACLASFATSSRRQAIGGEIALPRNAALRRLAVAVNARKSRDEQPPQSDGLPPSLHGHYPASMEGGSLRTGQ